MHREEVDFFVNALESVKEEFYLEAINKFKTLIKEFPESELCDDAEFNIGLCYFNMIQFGKAIESFEKVIYTYPDSTISILEGDNEFGKTAAKSYYAIINCYLAQGNIEIAEMTLEKLDDKKFIDSYIIQNDNKISYLELAKKIIEQYKKNS